MDQKECDMSKDCMHFDTHLCMFCYRFDSSEEHDFYEKMR